MTEETSRTGLRRKIWSVFILQAAAIGFAAVFGVYGASVILKNVLIKQALEAEAKHYWMIRESNPFAPTADTYNMKGYILGAGEDKNKLPASVRDVPVGLHQLSGKKSGSIVFVDEKNGERLILQFKQEQVDTLAFWYGMVPLAFVLAVVYLIAFTTYRASKRAVSPIIWLANKVKQWDPNNPDINSIRPENLPRDVEGEALTLASSLHEYASRINKFVERERNFTRDASHELRTPLTVIRVAGDMMSGDPQLSQMARKSLVRIQQAGTDMEALIESFLILAREGDTGLPDEDFSVADVIADEVEKAQVLLRDKSVTLTLQVVSDFELHAPARVLTVMFTNLLRNACHYTDEGSVNVLIEHGRISVIDTGVGMSKDELDHIFEPFFRGGEQKKSGQGIGLSIVKRLSDRYHWPVTMESNLGQGTHASIHFPKIVDNVSQAKRL
jgi:signal transduction histidine kinase